jgi:N,N'-diacetyllegionaminate synthase
MLNNSLSGHVEIIAEIGINHEGDVKQCAKMIELAAAAGVDAVKLQTIDANSNYVEGTESYKVFKGSELTREETSQMFELAHSLGIKVFTTSGDLPTVEWVDKLNPDFWKISSGLLTHHTVVKELAKLGRTLLISTGLGTVEEIDRAIEVVRQNGDQKIVVFQCTSLYPAPLDTLNLATIQWMRERYAVDVGFSDHSIGTDAAFLAVGAGATMIEKHFTLNANRTGFDHAISLEPAGLKKMVNRIRLAESILGDSLKAVSPAQKQMRKKFLRTIVALSDIQLGDALNEKNVGVKRPLLGGQGLDPGEFGRILNMRAARKININEPISINDVQ